MVSVLWLLFENAVTSREDQRHTGTRDPDCFHAVIFETLFLLQELEHGARVEEEDMAHLIQQLEGRVGTEVESTK